MKSCFQNSEEFQVLIMCAVYIMQDINNKDYLGNNKLNTILSLRKFQHYQRTHRGKCIHLQHFTL
jgi:hypothetical protein